MRYTGGAASEKGDYRKKNQDRVAVFIPTEIKGHLALGCVFDGIGSYKDSEISAQMMVDGCSRWIDGIVKLYPDVYEADEVADDLGETITELNELIVDYREDTGIDIGCTMSVMLLIEQEFFIFHMGDSRIYKVNEELQQLSRDEVSTIEKNGEIKKFLANYAGKKRDIWVSRCRGSVEPGDVFLICSDGLYKTLSREEIPLDKICGKSQAAITSVCENLIRKAYGNGEKDNTSCVILSASAD